ncbi:Rha family transcriptional regulator [Paenibacillus polymyxa]|uniref:Rha family transcriptional regulator n=1 Tax=Paenibacillus polymyxa TaxID=1406 RepID=UPI002AB41D6A|nr:Rha family transcriptional regulator [Paenibacillus polymyxa]MDY7990656.1 Rha family transcriptional regulator [Paenibacillus polymyxa]MDY8117534.1 Rha family transcriptional regulator [Paenibacillus polymyxa]
MNQLVFIQKGQAVTDSLTVAEAFGKEHRRVMQDIRELPCSDDFRLHHFVQSDYTNGQGRPTPKYLMTEQGFTMLVMGYTGPKAMEFKERYITEFHRLREQIQTAAVDTSQLSPILQLLIQQEQQQQAIIQRQDATDKRVAVIQETILQRDDDWRDKLNGMLNGAARRSGGVFRDLRTRSYEMLESRAKCDLNRRLRNLRDRLQETGATKTKISETNRLDVIEADPKLKEIYTTIVKELSIGTLT